ncbi:MAG: serine acetyltransferase [Ignavibacteriales bacterium]|nr:serine acetyltransferase [Ignavibacteriales bacterium]
MNADMEYNEFAKTLKERRDDHSLGFQMKKGTQEFVDNMMSVLFPHFCKEGFFTTEEIESRLVLLERDLKRLLIPILKDTSLHLDEIAMQFMHALPNIHDKLWLDAEAITSGDPAAESVDEVILAYPGFTAIAYYRLAHELYLMHVPIFPRLITEYAHQMTGIDIHPGARIGSSFAIDHGTGIVIGESSIIGNNVKIYQGVTLGALSVDKKFAKSKRHPTIEDDVVIYAQAIILGGETVVGRHSVIGGNVWLTASVPPFSSVYQESKVTVRPKEMTGAPIDFSI